MPSAIEWTDETWNPVVGCSRVSPGCENCYAETMAARQVLMSQGLGRESVYLPVVDAERRRWTREVAVLTERLADPLAYKPGTRVFVVSMGDPFHDGVPFEFLLKMWVVMGARRDVTFQVLTKRPARMLEFLQWLRNRANHDAARGGGVYLVGDKELPGPAYWPDALPNVWLGVSVEDQRCADERIPLLLKAPAPVHFLSCEPLLGPLDLSEWIERIDFCGSCEAENDPQEDDECPACGATSSLISTWGAEQAERYRTRERYTTPAGDSDVDGVTPQIGWIIVGGESGPGARPMRADWVRSLRDQCEQAGPKFFFKQWGGVNKKTAGRVLDGRTHDAMPEVRNAT